MSALDWLGVVAGILSTAAFGSPVVFILGINLRFG